MFAARAIPRQTVGHLGEPREQGVHALVIAPDAGGAVFAGHRADTDVFIHGQMLEHAPALRHHHRAAVDHLGPQRVGDLPAVEADVAVADKAVLRLEQTADGPQRSGFAGPVGAQQGNHIAAGHLQTHTAQHLHDVVVNHLDVVDFQQRCVGLRPGHGHLFGFGDEGWRERLADGLKNAAFGHVKLHAVHPGMIAGSEGDRADRVAR